MEESICLARIVNTQGIKGELKLIIETDFVEERFQPGQRLYLEHKQAPSLEVTVEKMRPHRGTYIVKFAELTSIQEAEAYKNGWVTMDQEDQHELPENEYYHHQIIGLEVLTTEGESLGKVDHILTLGPNDVWVIEPHQGSREILIPVIHEVIQQVDLEAGQIVIEVMEGLLPDED